MLESKIGQSHVWTLHVDWGLKGTSFQIHFTKAFYSKKKKNQSYLKTKCQMGGGEVQKSATQCLKGS